MQLTPKFTRLNSGTDDGRLALPKPIFLKLTIIVTRHIKSRAIRIHES